MGVCPGTLQPGSKDGEATARKHPLATLVSVRTSHWHLIAHQPGLRSHEHYCTAASLLSGRKTNNFGSYAL